MQRTRQSRRFACDRCRTYKLRCERFSPHQDSCERCSRSGVACAAAPPLTASRRSEGRVPDSHMLSYLHPRSPRAFPTSSTAESVLPESSRSTAQTVQAQTLRQGSNDRLPDLTRPMDVSMNSSAQSFPIDFSMGDFCFDGDNSSPQSAGAILPLHRESISIASTTFDDPNSCRDSAIATSSSSPPPLVMDVSGTRCGHAWNAHRDILKLSARLVDDYHVLRDEEPYSDFSSPMDTLVQRALRDMSQYCDILKRLEEVDRTKSCLPTQRIATTTDAQDQSALDNTTTSSATSFSFPPSKTWPRHEGSLPDNPGSSAQRYNNLAYTAAPGTSSAKSPSQRSRRGSSDPVLAASLTTAYIMLTRTWRLIFARLHRLLILAPAGTQGGFSMLPGLQLGGFSVRSSPDIQMIVLLELCSSMLYTIETCLGIAAGPFGYSVSDGSNGDSNVNNSRDSQKPTSAWSLRMEPMSVSVRETLLSQEMLRTAAEPAEDELGRLSLREIIREVGKELERRR